MPLPEWNRCRHHPTERRFAALRMRWSIRSWRSIRQKGQYYAPICMRMCISKQARSVSLIGRLVKFLQKYSILQFWANVCQCINLCKNKKLLAIRLTALMVPGPGIEPGWIAPTVFETVASTDSAIRADGGGIARGKVTKFFLFLARGGNYFIWGIHGGGFTGDSGDFRRSSPEAGSRTFNGALRGGEMGDGWRWEEGEERAGNGGIFLRGRVIFCGGRCSRCRF